MAAPRQPVESSELDRAAEPRSPLVARISSHGRTVHFDYFPAEGKKDLDTLIKELGEVKLISDPRDFYPSVDITGLSEGHNISRESLIAGTNGTSDKEILKAAIHAVRAWKTVKGAPQVTVEVKSDEDLDRVTLALKKKTGVRIFPRNNLKRHGLILEFPTADALEAANLSKIDGIKNIKYQNTILIRDYPAFVALNEPTPYSVEVEPVKPKEGATSFFASNYKLRVTSSSPAALKAATDRYEEITSNKKDASAQ